MYKTHFYHLSESDKKRFNRYGYYNSNVLCGQKGEQNLSHDIKKVTCKRCLKKFETTTNSAKMRLDKFFNKLGD